MKTPGQRGAFGDWLTRARTQRYATQADALRDFERLAGLRITPSQYAQWESGSRVPKVDNPKVARLYEFFGSSPQSEEAEPSLEDQPGFVAALDRQTAAIERQTAVMERLLARLLEGSPTGVPPQVQQEVAEAELDLAASLDSETTRQSGIRREP